MLDLLIKGGILPDGRQADIAIKEDKIKEVLPRINSEAREVYECSNCLVSPPFVDPHFHLDATLSRGIPRANRSGTLLEGIKLWSELKPLLTYEAVKERALAYCDWAVSMGLLAIRTHVDVCDPNLTGVEALRDVQAEIRPYMDLQLVAFPQDGLFRSPNGLKNLCRALDLGVEVIGGIPHFERTMQDGTDSVAKLCSLAAQRDLVVDIHCDETDDPMSRHIETLANETISNGLKGRVTASHLTSMHSMDNYFASKLLDLIAEAEISVVANPLVNIIVQGQHDTYPKRRGLTRVPEMIELGIRVGWGQDCVLDPWYPLGKADMLDVAHMGLHLAQMTSRDEIQHCFEMITTENAHIMGLESYGIEQNCRADLVVLDAADPVEAIRLRADRLLVVSRGKVVSRKTRSLPKLAIAGRPEEVIRWHSRPKY